MSKQARLLLLSGTAGSGTTSACAATIAALEDEGLSASFVDMRTAMASGDGSGALIGQLLGIADERPAEWWGGLPVIGYLAGWRTVRQAVVGDETDAVVVDLGELSLAGAVIDFPATAHRIASSALTADLAIKADPDDVDSAFARMTSLRDELASLLALLFGSTTSMRLVAEPSAYSIDRVVRAAGALALQGVDVDGIIVNRCARKSDPVPLREEHEALLGGVALSADGPLVWKATGRVRAVPKGRSAMGPLGSSRVLGEHTLGIVSDDEGFDLHVPLTGAARAGTRVGRFEDSLVVEFDGAIRWLALPSVLRRCRPLEASRGTEGLHVRFVPDPALWREDLPTGGAA